LVSRAADDDPQEDEQVGTLSAFIRDLRVDRPPCGFLTTLRANLPLFQEELDMYLKLLTDAFLQYCFIQIAIAYNLGNETVDIRIFNKSVSQFTPSSAVVGNLRINGIAKYNYRTLFEFPILNEIDFTRQIYQVIQTLSNEEGLTVNTNISSSSQFYLSLSWQR
jgi:hypothetical protein